MFYGETRISIDEKGRVSIPTEHRVPIMALCGGLLVICYNPYESECLWLFPKPEWERIREQAMRLSSAKAAHREFQRRLVGSAAHTDMDANGRILLPHAARSQAALGKGAVLLGLAQKFELWSDAAHAARMQAPISEASITPEMLELNF
jgi:MraZ protein